MQPGLYSRFQDDLMPSCCFTDCTGYPSKQWILYKMAVFTFRVWQTSIPAYLIGHIKPRSCARHLRSSDTSLGSTKQQYPLHQAWFPSVRTSCLELFLERYLIAHHSQSSSPDSTCLFHMVYNNTK